MTLLSEKEGGPTDFHTPLEMQQFASLLVSHDSTYLQGRNEVFTAAGECTGCHGFDINGVASVDADGNDINVADDWRATMMAMAAKDPFWKAKVSHEGLVSPDLLDELESSCTDCHAPLGFYNAMHLGEPHYTMADLALDSTALDGVSCGACHQISAEGVGTTFSGKDINYSEDTIYGPYPKPFGSPMTSFVGFAPVYSEHISTSEVCASCHTLITETVGLDGQFNGNEFVEQATYHEWLNSSYNINEKASLQCQGCHMDRIDEGVVIAANLLNLPERSPFYLHDIVGGNSFMLKLMKDNRDTLGIRAFGSHFDDVIDKTLVMLQERSVDLFAEELERTEETLSINVDIRNKAGHKFPSGYPSRLSFVRVVATVEGDTVFASGLMDDDYRIIGRDLPYEPHHDVIDSPDQVQVYELVMADEAGQETTVLSYAETALKDNRLAPLGFTSTHSAYDTTRVYGEALNDDDFNLFENGAEGSGTDHITYMIELDDPNALVDISVEMYYQAVPPRWLEEMFEFSSDEIDHFQEMYDAADKELVLLASADLQSAGGVISVRENYQPDLQVYPNPSRSGRIFVGNTDGYAIDRIQVMGSGGQFISDTGVIRAQRASVVLPEAAGIYYLKIESAGGQRVERVLRL